MVKDFLAIEYITDPLAHAHHLLITWDAHQGWPIARKCADTPKSIHTPGNLAPSHLMPAANMTHAL